MQRLDMNCFSVVQWRECKGEVHGAEKREQPLLLVVAYFLSFFCLPVLAREDETLIGLNQTLEFTYLFSVIFISFLIPSGSLIVHWVCICIIFFPIPDGKHPVMFLSKQKILTLM